MESSSAEKGPGVLVDIMLNMSQPCALTAKNTKCIPDYIRQSVISTLGKVILPLYSSVMRPNSCSAVGSQYKRDILESPLEGH